VQDIGDRLSGFDEFVAATLHDWRVPGCAIAIVHRDGPAFVKGFGLPRHDMIWYHGGLTRREMFDALRYLEPNRDFRTTWQYQSLMFVAAGVLIKLLRRNCFPQSVV
jgi:hypothetical protein